MKAKVKFFEERNGERYYYALGDFLPCTFNFSNKATVTRGYRRVIEKCRRSLYMVFGQKTIKSEAFMCYDDGRIMFDNPIATANVELYF